MRNRTIARLLGVAAVAASAAALTVPAQASTAAGPVTARQASGTVSTTGNLAYGGGNVVTAPSIYIVYWGSQWGTSSITNDPSGEATLQKNFFSSAYGSGDTYFTSQTQYCQGVAVGTTQCNGAGTAVGHPSSNPVKATWLDSGVTAPRKPSSSQIAAEAVRAASHFGVSGDNVQIIVDVPHGVVPSGFKTQYCAWHDHTTASGGGDLPYTNFPYVTDAGSGCGANFVATGSSGVNGATEGVTIVGGHEYAETITDPAPSSGWVDPSGAETGDKCAWISSGQGASAVIALNGSYFAVQSLWSNNYGGGAGNCVTYYASASNQH
jgi:serine protease